MDLTHVHIPSAILKTGSSAWRSSITRAFCFSGTTVGCCNGSGRIPLGSVIVRAVARSSPVPLLLPAGCRLLIFRHLHLLLSVVPLLLVLGLLVSLLSLFLLLLLLFLHSSLLLFLFCLLLLFLFLLLLLLLLLLLFLFYPL